MRCSSGCFYVGTVHLLLLSAVMEGAFGEPNENFSNQAPCVGSRATAPCRIPTRRLSATCLVEERASNSRKSMVVALTGGALDEKSTTSWERQLPTGVIRPRTITMLWCIPFLTMAFSFWSFQWTSLWFHSLAQWSSSNTWFPPTEDKVNLQTNVVVRRARVGSPWLAKHGTFILSRSRHESF